MSTTTMMSNHHRRFVTPVGVGPSNKRKPWDNLDGPKRTFKRPTQPSILRPGPTTSNPAHKPPEPAPNNQLLAGYLAHEFLTKGTLFGEPWDPARAEAVPVSADSRREKPAACSSRGARAEPSRENYERYVEVADLLKTDRAQLSGVVNPTQLARILQM